MQLLTTDAFQAMLDSMIDPAAIVDVLKRCVVLFNSAFARLTAGGLCESGGDILKLFPAAGAMLEELCQEAITSESPLDTCFSWQDPGSHEPGLWTARLNRLVHDAGRSLVILCMHEETDHIRLIRRLDTVLSGVPGQDQGADLVASLDALMERASVALDTEHVWTMLSTDDGLELRLIAHSCPHSALPASVNLSSLPTVVDAISSGRPIYIGRHVASPHEQKLMVQMCCDGMLACPIQLSEGSGAAVALFPRGANEPSADRVCLLEIVAGKCASLIESHKNMVTLATLVRAERRALVLAEQGAHQIRSLLNSLSDGVVILDKSGAVRFANDALTVLLGIDKEKLNTWHQLFDDTSLRVQAFPGRLRSAFDAEAMLRFISPEGRDVVTGSGAAARSLKITCGGVQDSESALESIILVFHDWTTLQRMRQSQQDVLRFVSHDLRTPLTQIMARAQLIELTAERADSVRRAASSIVKASKRMNEMIQDITDSARLEIGASPIHSKPVDVMRVMTDIVEVLSSANPSSHIGLIGPDNLPTIITDPLRLERIVNNLVSNAVKYSPPGSPVTISIDTADSEIVVSVSDRGVGMSDEEKAHVFERYFRSAEAVRAAEGLGLGLYISKSFVEALGGRIWVESAIGQGSTFSFTLPLTIDSGAAK
ncbi:MAG: Sensor histidine kinase YycG [Firmicutes bacterium ADurb.Bin506]|nr:MAG: Sensor histidine kinase YycG [Firmicutes bacterium ADurb.Bin506]